MGYVFVKFALDRPLPPQDNITVTLTCKLAGRKDTITVTRANQRNAIWEIFSDKYLNETSFQYEVQVEVVGPNFTDDPVQYGTTSPITVALPSGRLKYINPLFIPLPKPTPEQIDTINQYIKAFQAQPHA